MPARRWYDPRTWLQPAVSASEMLAAGTKPSVNLDTETGVSGTESYGGILRHDDPNPEWDNFQVAVRLSNKMRRTDSKIREILQVVKLPLLGATWEAIPPEGGDEQDQRIADFVNESLFDDDAMDYSWDEVLRHILLMLDHGFSVLEIVWKVDEHGNYRIKRLAPRLSNTIREWHVNRDGSLRAIRQYAPIVQAIPNASPAVVLTGASRTGWAYITIDAQYLAVFTHDKEGDNYEGVSALRPAWRNFFFKDEAYRCEAVRRDRWGVGIPTAEIQAGYTLTEAEQTTLTELLKKMRNNEKAWLILPPSIRIRILPDSSGSGGGGTGGAVQWVEHQDSQMGRAVLAGFLSMGSQNAGLHSDAFGSRLTDLFLSCLRGFAMNISSELKRQVVKRLCDLNFVMDGRQYPSVKPKALDLSDIDAMIRTLAQLNGSFITPDDDTENLLRKIMHLPPLPEELSRKTALKKAEEQQAAAGAMGAPGQQAPPNMGPGGVVHHPAGSALTESEPGVVHHEARSKEGEVAHHEAQPQVGGVVQHPTPKGVIHHEAGLTAPDAKTPDESKDRGDATS